MAIRILALFCLLNFSAMMFAEKLHTEGLLLARFKNLPHRSLGMLFWSATLEPQRADFTKDYIVNYMIFTDGEIFLEGSTRPVVPCYAVVMARRFPRNQDLQLIREVIMKNHFNKLTEQAQNLTH
jgi:hypothetical protein